MRYFLLLIVFMFYAGSAVAETKNISAFATIPVLHEGRIKPLDSLARSTLRLFSGRESLPGIGPSEWLAEVLFNPASAAQRPAFKIRNPDLLGMLALEKKKLYSFAELLPKVFEQRQIISAILGKPENEWTQSQHDLIELQKSLAIFEQFTESFSALQSLDIQIPDDAPDYLKPLQNKDITLKDTLQLSQNLSGDIKKILKEKGEAIDTYTPQEQVIAKLVFAEFLLKGKGASNALLKIIPEKNGANWISPWTSLLGNPAADQSELLALWLNLAQSSTPAQWNTITQQIQSKTLGTVNANRINTEYTYNLLHPHEASLFAYLICLVLACGGIFLNKTSALRISGYALLCGVIIHIAGIIARIYILERPPVSTLYETILFVGAIVVLYGLRIWLIRRDVVCLIGAAIIGMLLHTLSLAHNGDGDSMIMLEAVLNTQFWLATHVLCITAGYAFCLVASAFAHYLLCAKSPPAYVTSSLYTSLLLALFFTVVGTILGGIWADQSWGRFWGWDPKENGALLIALWLIWVIHGRISGQFSQIAFHAGAAYLSVVVALSWFGVNLLGVGLHSYGFTDALALWLGLFIAAETILIMFLWRRISHAH